MAANFGEELRLAREARGISLREISEQTRISMRYLEAIETNDYKRLPGGIFNRSFIKAYAKYVGYDEQAALEGYTRTAREQGDPDEISTTPYQSRVYTDSNTRSPVVTLLLTILILAVLSLVVWGAKHWYERREAARADNKPATTNQQSAQGSAPAPAAPATTASAPATDAFHIQIKARGESVWISTQEDDAKKASGIVLQPDEAKEFDPQQRLKIGYAPSKAKVLEVNINGRPARVPQDKSEMLITKETYEQFLQ